MPKVWSVGISFAATAGSSTRARIRRAMKSVSAALTSLLVEMSL